MVNLNDKTNEITLFLESSISQFQKKHEVPSSVGIYCSPSSGWITTNFNINKELANTEINCPDFEFVEFDIFELEEWKNEYENDTHIYQLNGIIKKQQ